MKKPYEIPTIDKIDFRLSDKAMCTELVTSGVTTDAGIVVEMTDTQTSGMTE